MEKGRKNKWKKFPARKYYNGRLINSCFCNHLNIERWQRETGKGNEKYYTGAPLTPMYRMYRVSSLAGAIADLCTGSTE
ncbi:MAG: hypothetical protein AABY86_00900, partial [Bdellovibrionota bacterium]